VNKQMNKLPCVTAPVTVTLGTRNRTWLVPRQVLHLCLNRNSTLFRCFVGILVTYMSSIPSAHHERGDITPSSVFQEIMKDELSDSNASRAWERNDDSTRGCFIQVLFHSPRVDILQWLANVLKSRI
jgi:hypothetical protein